MLSFPRCMQEYNPMLVKTEIKIKKKKGKSIKSCHPYKQNTKLKPKKEKVKMWNES